MSGTESATGILWIYNILFFAASSADFTNFRNAAFEAMAWAVV